MKAFNSYSRIMFNPAMMRKVITEIAGMLPTLQQEYGFDTIAVTGKSGCALGFALSMVTDIHVVYVRKGETSHGDMVEGDGHEFHRYAFFDDFVCSGASRDRVHEELVRYAENRQPCRMPQRVLTIEYSKMVSASRVSTASSTPSLHVVDPDSLPDADRLRLRRPVGFDASRFVPEVEDTIRF